MYRNFYILLLHVLVFGIVSSSCKNSTKEQKQVKEIRPVVTAPDGWQLMFDGISLNNWEKTSFGTEGPVMVSDGNIVINYGDGCSGITWTDTFPKVNYEVQLEARKMVGNDFFCGMTFPVKDNYCSLIVGGWGGPVVGLSCIDGVDASENETQVLKNFEKEVWYTIRLQVSDSNVKGWIDGVKLVDFNYSNHELSIRPEVTLSKPFGICTWMTTAELRNIWMRNIESGL